MSSRRFVDNFDILFSKSVYLAGETVHGHVTLTAPTAVKVGGVEIRLQGESRTSWINKTSDNIYDSLEPHINDVLALDDYFLQYNGAEDDVLPAGHHVIPFRFHLPAHLPSSFEGEFGSIRYACHASAHVSWDAESCLPMAVTGKSDQQQQHKTVGVEKALKIVALTPLSAVGGAQGPLSVRENFELVGCCCFGVRNNSAKLAASILLPKRAFLPGEKVPVSVSVCAGSSSSSSSAAAKRVDLSLVQEVHFRSVSFFQSASDTKTQVRVMDTVPVLVQGVSGGGQKSKAHHGQKAILNVPADLLPSSVKATSPLITIRYFVRLDLVDKKCELFAPIGIATLRDVCDDDDDNNSES